MNHFENSERRLRNLTRRGGAVTQVAAVVVAAMWLRPATAADRTLRDFSFETKYGTRHDARLVLPPAAGRNGYSVLLIGGGLVTDMHWTIHGSVEHGDEIVQLTIDGANTHDADALAEAIADAGFIVMQWSSIHQGDLLHAQNPTMATPMPYPESVEVTRAALKAMGAQPEIDPTRIILLGHSLGATRACELANDAKGVVMLAGAYLSRVSTRPSELSAAAVARWREFDRNGDERLDQTEFGAAAASEKAPRVFAPFTLLDADDDGSLAGWELAAAELLNLIEPQTPQPFATTDEFRDGAAWPSDVLMARRDLPVLSLHAGEDVGSVHGPILAELARLHGRDAITIEYAPGLGHQFSQQRNGKIAAMEESVIERVVAWLRANFPAPAND